MELGLEYTGKMAIPPGMAEFQLSGYCVPECTAVVSNAFLNREHGMGQKYRQEPCGKMQ